MFPKFDEGTNSARFQSLIPNSSLICQSELEGLTLYDVTVGIKIHTILEIFKIFQGVFGAIIGTNVN